MGPARAVAWGAGTIGATVSLIFSTVVGLFRGGGAVLDQLAGPVGAVKFLGEAGAAGSEIFIYTAAGLSIMIGIFNLLPLPALDGGRILFLAVEAVRRRSLDARREGYIHLVGFVLLIARLAVHDREAAEALAGIKPRSPLPIVADIHFDHRLALLALEAGVDKLRINPGNIGSRERTRIVARAAKERGVPIRIGANIGSLRKSMLRRFGGASAEALVESALEDVQVLEDLDFHDIVISVKASDVPMVVDAYTRIADRTAYPLHVGGTEAGTAWAGAIKSAAGIGAILARGIGDTIRVSLAADPVEEVKAGFEILKSLGLRTKGVQLVACPSCGRAE